MHRSEPHLPGKGEGLHQPPATTPDPLQSQPIPHRRRDQRQSYCFHFVGVTHDIAHAWNSVAIGLRGPPPPPSLSVLNNKNMYLIHAPFIYREGPLGIPSCLMALI